MTHDLEDSQHMEEFVDKEARHLARQLVLKLHAKLAHEAVILELGRQFCRTFFGEFQRQHQHQPNSASCEESLSDDTASVELASLQRKVDGRQCLQRQESDERATVLPATWSSATTTTVTGGTGTGGGGTCGGDEGYSCSTIDLTSAGDVGQQRRSSTVSLSPLGGGTLGCSSCQTKSFFRRRLSLHGLNPFHRRGSEGKADKCPFAGTTGDLANNTSNGNTGNGIGNTGNNTGNTGNSHSNIGNGNGNMSFPSTRHRCTGEVRTTRVDMTLPVEIVREAVCTYVASSDAGGGGAGGAGPGGNGRWEACRLTLCRPVDKTVCGHLLQIFTPSKSTKAKKSIFCSAILTASDAVDSEALSHDCVFIIQLTDGSKLMFRLETSDDKRGWVYDMQRTGMTQAKMPGNTYPMTVSNSSTRPRLSTFPPSEARRPDSFLESPTTTLTLPSVPGVTSQAQGAVTSQGRCGEASRQNSVTSQTPSVTSCPSRAGTPTVEAFPVSQQMSSVIPLSDLLNEERGLTDALATFPGYHRQITRCEAAALVVGVSGTATPPCLDAAHGRFLIRPSETRPGEFVVTFNAYGKPKHLRISVEENGQCRVQQLWFESVKAMTEHYRQHPLPLESGHSSDVMLTECILPVMKMLRHRSDSVSGVSVSVSETVSVPCRSAMMHFSASDGRFKSAHPSIDEEGKGMM